MNVSETHITLNTGARMPRLGLGTWKSEPSEVGNAVEYALFEAGYKHIDCAAVYANEKEVGSAFKKVFESGKVKRDEVFVTGKLWNTAHKRGDVRGACEATLSDLGLEYLDLYLMHWGIATPPNDIPGARQLDEHGNQILEKISVQETWEAMESLVNAGLVKAIGVANFGVPMIIDVLSYAKIKPAVVQVELHPYLQQSRLVEFCQYRDIAVTAYSPLGSPGNAVAKGKPNLVEDSVVKSIAKECGKTPAQILIRFGVQRNLIVIPKSVKFERILENAHVFDFVLSDEHMKHLQGLERNLRFVDPYEWGKIPYFS